MKVRLHRDSLRLRLTPGDVEQLVSSGTIRETTRFGPGSELSCVLGLSNDLDQPTASFDSSGISIALPAQMARDWASSDTVGIRHEQPTDAGRHLVILVEKDFECLDEPADPLGETYFPNPKSAC